MRLPLLQLIPRLIFCAVVPLISGCLQPKSSFINGVGYNGNGPQVKGHALHTLYLAVLDGRAQLARTVSLLAERSDIETFWNPEGCAIDSTACAVARELARRGRESEIISMLRMTSLQNELRNVIQVSTVYVSTSPLVQGGESVSVLRDGATIALGPELIQAPAGRIRHLLARAYFEQIPAHSLLLSGDLPIEELAAAYLHIGEGINPLSGEGCSTVAFTQVGHVNGCFAGRQPSLKPTLPAFVPSEIADRQTIELVWEATVLDAGEACDVQSYPFVLSCQNGVLLPPPHALPFEAGTVVSDNLAVRHSRLEPIATASDRMAPPPNHLTYRWQDIVLNQVEQD